MRAEPEQHEAEVTRLEVGGRVGVDRQMRVQPGHQLHHVGGGEAGGQCLRRLVGLDERGERDLEVGRGGDEVGAQLAARSRAGLQDRAVDLDEVPRQKSADE